MKIQNRIASVFCIIEEEEWESIYYAVKNILLRALIFTPVLHSIVFGVNGTLGFPSDLTKFRTLHITDLL